MHITNNGYELSTTINYLLKSPSSEALDKCTLHLGQNQYFMPIGTDATRYITSAATPFTIPNHIILDMSAHSSVYMSIHIFIHRFFYHSPMSGAVPHRATPYHSTPHHATACHGTVTGGCWAMACHGIATGVLRGRGAVCWLLRRPWG